MKVFINIFNLKYTSRLWVAYREYNEGSVPHISREGVQWNLRIKYTLGQGVLSFIERFPLFGG